MSTTMGAGIARIDGHAKVTGTARYTADLEVAGVAHAALVVSTIPNGHVVDIDTAAAQGAPGVIEVLTHQNAPPLAKVEFLRLVQDNRIWHAGQPIGLVIADTAAQARRAARLVTARHENLPAVIGMEKALHRACAPKNFLHGPPNTRRGEPERAFEGSGAKIERHYTTPTHNHNPMEPHAVVAVWDGDTVTVHTTTQALFMAQSVIAAAFGIEKAYVRVVCKTLGGGFGSKGRAWWPAMVLAILAARILGRPVKLELRREDMFAVVGRRQQTIQTVRLGAAGDGILSAIHHDITAQTSAFADYSDAHGFMSRMMYACPNVTVSHRNVRTNEPLPLPMRAPGQGTGSFALESAIDELAYELKLDPLELRRRNYANFDPHENRPWSSNGLLECYAAAAEAFRWAHRPLEPKSLREEELLVGWGMASAYYPVFQAPSAASISIAKDGTAVVRCGTQDIGTGTATILTQIVADALGWAPESISAELGDTMLPEGPPSVGSMTAASVTPAVRDAAKALQHQLMIRAVSQVDSHLYRLDLSAIRWAGDRIETLDGRKSELVLDIVCRDPAQMITACAKARKTEVPDLYSSNAYGAIFVEVRVDADLGLIRVARVVAAYAAGKIINSATARSQCIGGIVFGLGMALHEETRTDPKLGRIVNANLADYLVPVHADVPEIDVRFVEEDDLLMGTCGVKGIGMIGTVGTAAAVANAVFHATGKRIRNLPIRLEQLLW